MRKKGFITCMALMLMVCLALPAYGAGMATSADKKTAAETPASYSDPSASDPLKDAKISQEKAIDILKVFFEVPEDYKYKPEAYLNTGWQPGNRRVWIVNFFKPYHSSIYAVIDADSGEILSYNKSEDWNVAYGRRRVFLARYTREEARVFAENFIKKINPDKYLKVGFVEENYYPGLKLGGLFEPASYFFRFARTSENIPPVDFYYGEEGINVTVDAVTGKVVGYNLNWSEDKPLDEKIISKKQAEEIYVKYLGPELAYVRGFDEEKGKTEDFARLVYVPQRFGYMGPPLAIRAADGALINYAGDKVKQIEPLAEADFSDAKSINPTKLETPLTKEQAQKLAEEEIKKFDLSNMSLQSFNDVSYNGKAQDLFFFNFNSTDGKAGASVTVNAATGRVQYFGFWKNSEPYYPETQNESSSPEAISREDAKNAALEYIQKYLPDKAGMVRSMDYPQESNTGFRAFYQPYYFNFTRIVNGIPYMGNNISIGVDLKGEIISFNYAWDDIAFPVPGKNILSREKAASIMIDKIGIALAYIMPKMYDYYGPDAPQPTPKPEKILVYALKRLSDAAYIDPFTGDILNYAFKQPGTKRPASFEANIKGETGRREAELLMDQGIFEPSMSIDLESVPGIKDAVKFFASCLGMGSIMYQEYGPNTDEKADPYKRYIDAALDQHLITDSETGNLDRPLERQDLAKLAVRFLGFEALAAKGEIFKLDVSDSNDIDGGYKGYVSSVLALGLMEKSGDRFLPKEKVKFGDMVQVLYRAAQILESGGRMSD